MAESMDFNLFHISLFVKRSILYVYLWRKQDILNQACLPLSQLFIIQSYRPHIPISYPLRLCVIMKKHHGALADFQKSFLGYFLESMGLSNVGRTFWEEWQPCITVMWHYAKTPRSTSRFLEIIFGLFFGKYVIVQTL